MNHDIREVARQYMHEHHPHVRVTVPTFGGIAFMSKVTDAMIVRGEEFMATMDETTWHLIGEKLASTPAEENEAIDRGDQRLWEIREDLEEAVRDTDWQRIRELADEGRHVENKVNEIRWVQRRVVAIAMRKAREAAKD